MPFCQQETQKNHYPNNIIGNYHSRTKIAVEENPIFGY
jgi:hypothetical protein